MTALAKGIPETAIKKLIENLVTDLYELTKQSIGNQIKKWSINKSVRRLHSQVHKIRQVKTLWQVDKAVDLKEFYCDSHVFLDKQRTKINQIEDFGNKNRIVIAGIAGQGKSILLRFLCSKVLVQGKNLPIFIELRRVFSDETLNDHIHQYLEIIGIPEVNALLLKTLLSSGKVILFLDGFDEVSEIDKSRIIHEIEVLALKYENLKIIITSRPESGIEVSPLFEVVKLSDLKNNEYKAVIKKLSEDTSFADNLIRQVESHKSKLNDLLCTPLLVTLLVMTYKSFQELPEQLSDFYDSIFQVLLQRHDGAKPGFKRPRRCPLNDNQYRSIFENLCFESKRKIKSIFNYDDISMFTKVALSKHLVDVDENKYIEDIVKVTCLILREGEDYRFIHKSVQEYYAAAFVKHRSEPVAKKFYNQMIVQGPNGPWNQELFFLREIDKYRFNKYFYLPYLCLILNCPTDNIPSVVPKVDIEKATTLIGEIKLGLDLNSSQNLLFFLSGTKYTSSRQINHLFDLDFSSLIKDINARKIVPDEIPKGLMKRINQEISIFSVKTLIDAGIMTSIFFSIAQEIIDESYRNAKKSFDTISKEESFDLNTQIDIY